VPEPAYNINVGLTMSRRRCVASWLCDWDRACTAAPQLARLLRNGRHLARPSEASRPGAPGSGEALRLSGVVPPRPRLVAVRSASMPPTRVRGRSSRPRTGGPTKPISRTRGQGGVQKLVAEEDAKEAFGHGLKAPNQGRSASSSWRGPTHRSSEAIGPIAYSEIHAMFLSRLNALSSDLLLD
jgi:hypothetical protein